MKRYARIEGDTVVEIIEPFERTWAMRPPIPEPLAEDVEVGSREALAHAIAVEAHETFVLGEVPIADRFPPAVVDTLVEIPDNRIVEPGFVYKDGAFHGPIPVLPPPMTAAEVRAERERRLNMSDWTQLRDVPDATAAKWAKYRQALRDVPAQVSFPADIAWPTPPQ